MSEMPIHLISDSLLVISKHTYNGLWMLTHVPVGIFLLLGFESFFVSY